MLRVATTPALPTGAGVGGRNGNIGSFEVDGSYLYAVPYSTDGVGE